MIDLRTMSTTEIMNRIGVEAERARIDRNGYLMMLLNEAVTRIKESQRDVLFWRNQYRDELDLETLGNESAKLEGGE